ncbi:hypothetical protein AB6A40_008448 [Gnathostoma spinigerum]|uniref:Uncharacterized protein n=1 Tax=Gnathostoma spinigerum TaxID=75299 RepID=A0ABD6EWU9_9BILA
MRGRNIARRGGVGPLMPPFQTNRFSNGPVFASRPAPFDLTLCEANFPRLKDFDDSELSQVHLVFLD